MDCASSSFTPIMCSTYFLIRSSRLRVVAEAFIQRKKTYSRMLKI